MSNPQSPTKTSLDSRRVSSNSTRNRYQPREAAIDRKGNSDLIDFIRQGPPGAAVNRIPKSVAPFMDDDFGGAPVAPGGRAVDATIPDIRYSQASTHETDASMPSIHSSINSNTALLKSKGASPATSSKMFDDDDMVPKRKTRRVKDPYAIDFSDEEDDDDDFMTTPKPPAKKEESLAEFLRNYEPPPEPVAPPMPVSQKVPKKKASAPSLIGRFTRGSNSNHPNNGSVSQSPFSSDTRSISSRNGAKGGYIPIQVSMPPGYDKYGQVDRPPMPHSSGSAGRVPMKKFEPREPVSNVGRTSDLAAFLRNSEPPLEPVVQQPVRQEESSGGFAKIFSRRKK